MISPSEYTSGSPFRRLDSTRDSEFYATPRITEHIDERAVAALTKYNTDLVSGGGGVKEVLDVGASHVSHITPGGDVRVTGLGMNAVEMMNNPLLSRPNAGIVQDLNENPALPFEKNTFDFVLMQLTVDYLVKPVSVFKSVSSVLKPGGTFSVTFSDRVFMSKQIGIWSGKDDFDHIMTVVGYVAKSILEGGDFNIESLEVKVLSDGSGGKYDPLFAVEVRSKG
ncbi:hypothetical protein TrCOL_g12697 [Triparma columacea]|uniref:Methyltransferase type 11 domain-containing protein n=1 Tax=Triparma columacea TaxID=722753 RepID=A0A9W7LCP9_9STRA|nr:hypothetical protein TrCOL_g12697 [Triparma columacea]